MVAIEKLDREKQETRELTTAALQFASAKDRKTSNAIGNKAIVPKAYMRCFVWERTPIDFSSNCLTRRIGRNVSRNQTISLTKCGSFKTFLFL